MRKTAIIFFIVYVVISLSIMVYYHQRYKSFQHKNELLTKDSKSTEKYFHCIHKNRINIISNIPPKKNSVVFLGDSHFQYFEVTALFNDINLVNMGVAGETTREILSRLNDVLSNKPKTILFEGGFNDVYYNTPIDSVSKNIKDLIKKVKINLPNTSLFILEIPPTLVQFRDVKINTLNQKIDSICAESNVPLIRINNFFKKENGKINTAYFSEDGIHFNGLGYLKLKDILQLYIKNQPIAQ